MSLELCQHLGADALLPSDGRSGLKLSKVMNVFVMCTRVPQTVLLSRVAG